VCVANYYGFNNVLQNSGDNPSCTDGPPVTIDWAFDPDTQFVLDVNTFEDMRGARRVNKQMLMPRSVREKGKYLSCVSMKHPTQFHFVFLNILVFCTVWYPALSRLATRNRILHVLCVKYERISTVAWYRHNNLEWITCMRPQKRLHQV
jgi:hypothetical protein